MKFSVTSYAVFRSMTLDELIPRLGALGYDGVEVWGKDLEGASDERVQEIRAAADAQNLTVCATSPYFDFVPGGERWEKGLAACRTVVRQARILGTPIIRYREVDYIPSAEMNADHWSACLDGLKALCGLAAPDLIVGIECHENLPQDSVENILMMIEKVGVPNIKVIFQPSSYVGQDLGPILEALYPHTVHVHLGNRPNAGGEAPDGSALKSYLGDKDSAIDYDAFFEDLKGRGYDGFATIEGIKAPENESLSVEIEYLKRVAS
jgi:sugar phosphate isomerase/epimerase